MAIQLTQEEVDSATNNIRRHAETQAIEINVLGDDTTRIVQQVQNPQVSEIGVEAPVSNEYELNMSESLSFLYNLLWEDESELSKSEILEILHVLEDRERSLPFSFACFGEGDDQGITWPPSLKAKFYRDREKIGGLNWCHNIVHSRDVVRKQFNVKLYKTKTEFYKFYRFFGKVRLNITHFQLRNLVCCSSLSDGIYFPLSHHYEDYIDQSTYNTEEAPTYFKVNRLAVDDQLSQRADSMMLDCVLDSRKLRYNSSSRIASMACSSNLLACGTFEGGYLLQRIGLSSSNNTEEVCLTNNFDGITNHIVIIDDKELLCSSNDKYIRSINIETQRKDSIKLDFAVNCLTINPNNSNELLITGDHIDSFLLDKRMHIKTHNDLTRLRGHQDYGFACDWSPGNDNYLITGNQDCSVMIWDKRNTESSIYCWDSSLGKSSYRGGPVRNCKFSSNGKYLSWAETLDHIGIIQMDDLTAISPDATEIPKVQSLEFVGKCTGLNYVKSDNGDEELIVGVCDCPLGGVLNYRLESATKSLDFDFVF